MIFHPSRHVSQGGKKCAAESHFAALNVSGAIKDKIGDVCDMTSEILIDHLCENKTKRKRCDTTITL